MRRLIVLTALVTFITIGFSSSPTLSLERLAKPSGSVMSLVRIADMDRRTATKRTHRKVRAAHRHRHAHKRWYHRGIVVTSGHPLHRFPGEITYTYSRRGCCCCREGR